MFPGEAAALAAASPVFTDERIMKRFIRYFLKWTALFLLGSILAFLLVRMMPVSPVEQALTRDRLPQTAENIAYMEHRMGLDQSLPSQYFSWLLRFVSGNWGESLVSGADIKAQFIRKMPYSFSIGILGLLLASVAAFGIGYRAAVRGQGFDRIAGSLEGTHQLEIVYLLVQIGNLLLVPQVLLLALGKPLRQRVGTLPLGFVLRHQFGDI